MNTELAKSPEETVAFAKNFLKEALKETMTDRPLIFYLSGELGAGKTHFVKGLAEGFGIKDNVTSPTFVLIKKYAIPMGHRVWGMGHRAFYHIDCYRAYDSDDARQIGLDKIFKIPNAIIAVEWAERIKDIIPKPYFEIKMEHAGEGKRRIAIRKIKNCTKCQNPKTTQKRS